MKSRNSSPSRPRAWFRSRDGSFRLYKGDCLQILPSLPEHGSIPLVFADPPYFLSGDGITCHAGRMVSVNKGQWDRPKDIDAMHEFNLKWLAACQAALSPNGTIWVSGTRHVIFSVGLAMQQLGMKVLNEICWEKPNPPPNLSCRYFTHSTEIILWAAKTLKSKHRFNYELMKRMAGGRQMKSVWRIAAPRKDEKIHGRHPTQKPLALLSRVILASSAPGDIVLDPFSGSGTTGVAAVREARLYIGIEKEQSYLELSKRRFQSARKQGEFAFQHPMSSAT